MSFSCVCVCARAHFIGIVCVCMQSYEYACGVCVHMILSMFHYALYEYLRMFFMPFIFVKVFCALNVFL